ncbi:MAG: hydrogenase maturation protease [Rhodocyclales bacterium]|nr:hydrogenase maturation protease [Rhodocyclales bacterium]
MTAPVLVFGWGNPSRGDDALGPLFVERIEALRLPGVECLTDFQLQVEHALDLKGRQRVLFVDASIDTLTIAANRIEPGRDATFTTHAISPQSVMQTYLDIERAEPPPCWLLAIGGRSFELGESLSDDAAYNLDAALAWAIEWLTDEEKDLR